MYPYLAVDQFLQTLLGTRALASALELGVIDVLADGASSAPALAARLQLDGNGCLLLTELLRHAGVLEQHGDALALSDAFRAALAFRDLMEAKIAFSTLLLPDLVQGLSALVADPPAFMARSRALALFRYDRALDTAADNLADTERWLRLTTVLTRYEAAPLLDRLPLGGHRRLLDIGGNSGELARQALARHPQLTAVVADLPAVCALGRRHLAQAPERARVVFVALDALTDPLPTDCDLVCFKSMLHDWPEAQARTLLSRAVAALRPGGRVVIFERRRLEQLAAPPAFGQLPVLLFAGFYRTADFYVQTLTGLGLMGVEAEVVELDLPFMLVTAHKPTAGAAVPHRQG
jgi:SAM-dependent methyltransferase